MDPSPSAASESSGAAIIAHLSEPGVLPSRNLSLRCKTASRPSIATLKPSINQWTLAVAPGCGDDGAFDDGRRRLTEREVSSSHDDPRAGTRPP